MELSALGDDAVVIEWGGLADEVTLARVSAAVAALEADPPAGMIELVPAFTSLAVFYDVTRIADYETFGREVMRRAQRKIARVALKPQIVTIPVCYGGDNGPDLITVARHAGLTERQVVQLHTAETYTVGAVGFMPGFPYLVGLPSKLHTPRRNTPRTTVPRGSVAIGGAQTGVYPLESPGGWNLIGRTPLTLVDTALADPVHLRVGDRVKFKPISAEEYAAWR
ncbi:MAG: 5-oxoprolinase subunit PxpB [Opitutaceae bacterium]|nr:5-oxoprolinase subunit PxpB [Cephaloticoccus sp.]MCP5530795.1 5-oxoprolinase subunit PxpB [Opitutaceae bacterium]